MKTNPGVPFLFRLVLVSSAAPFAVYLVYRVASYHNITFPFWVWIIAAVLSEPLTLAARVSFKYCSYRFRAARLGAVLPPAIVGKEIGEYDVLRGILEIFKSGYPCMCCVNILQVTRASAEDNGF